MPYRAAKEGSNQPDVLQGIMTVDIAMSHVGTHDGPGLVGQGSGIGLPSTLPLTQRADGSWTTVKLRPAGQPMQQRCPAWRWQSASIRLDHAAHPWVAQHHASHDWSEPLPTYPWARLGPDHSRLDVWAERWQPPGIEGSPLAAATAGSSSGDTNIIASRPGRRPAAAHSQHRAAVHRTGQGAAAAGRDQPLALRILLTLPDKLRHCQSNSVGSAS
eukprot:COSAG01_NODE_48_length_31904_cov_21.696997_39_plen_216_part_00